MSTTTFKPILSAAEVWSCPESSEDPELAYSVGKLGKPVSQEILQRVAESLAPYVLDGAVVATGNGKEPCRAYLGLPIICEGQLKSCLILALACDEQSMGAFEIWSRDDRDELGLNGAMFAGLGRFAAISKHVRFPRGSGLPGQSWEDREAKLLSGLGNSPNFMRAAGARSGGLEIGLALPVMTTEHDLNSVVMLLSSRTTPIAKVFEIWDLAESATLRTRKSIGIEMNTEAETTYARGEGLVGRVWDSGTPLVTDDLATYEQKRLNELQAHRLSSAIAIPIHVGDQLKSVVLLLN